MTETRRVTIQDVARESGVSKQTDSRVINGRPDVSDATRQHILAIIQEMGYKPDPIVRSMKGNSHTLGCITPSLADPIFSIIVEYAQAEARSQGFFVLTGSAPLASYFDPPLTTIRQPMDKFGLIGAQLLIEAVKEKQYQPRAVKLKPKLVERDTCAPISS